MTTPNPDFCRYCFGTGVLYYTVKEKTGWVSVFERRPERCEGRLVEMVFGKHLRIDDFKPH
jgi:hypothetical protein